MFTMTLLLFIFISLSILINGQQRTSNQTKTWKQSLTDAIPADQLKDLCGFKMSKSKNSTRKLSMPSLPGTKVMECDDASCLPKHFTWLDAKGRCPSLGQIRTQRRRCGDSWAVASAAAISDRYCLNTNESRIFSAKEIARCATNDGGCFGSDPKDAMIYYKGHGVSTGGDPNIGAQRKGCQPYFNETSAKKCESTCDITFDVPYEQDKKIGVHGYQIISQNVDDIKLDLFGFGPLVATFDVYDDFGSYKEGIYQRQSTKLVSGHAVRLLGWGEEDGMPFWQLANSWGVGWGEGGFFRIILGQNECNIEGYLHGVQTHRDETVTEIQKKITTQQPQKTETQKPTTTATQKPTTTATQKPTTTASQKPTTTATEKPKTSATQKPTTTASQKPTTTATEKPKTSATQKPTTTATDVPTTTETQKPKTTATLKPTTIATEEPKPITIQNPTPVILQEPDMVTTEEPKIDATQEPAMIATEEPKLSQYEIHPPTYGKKPPTYGKTYNNPNEPILIPENPNPTRDDPIIEANVAPPHYIEMDVSIICSINEDVNLSKAIIQRNMATIRGDKNIVCLNIGILIGDDNIVCVNDGTVDGKHIVCQSVVDHGHQSSSMCQSDIEKICNKYCVSGKQEMFKSCL